MKNISTFGKFLIAFFLFGLITFISIVCNMKDNVEPTVDGRIEVVESANIGGSFTAYIVRVDDSEYLMSSGGIIKIDNENNEQ